MKGSPAANEPDATLLAWARRVVNRTSGDDPFPVVSGTRWHLDVERLIKELDRVMKSSSGFENG